MVKFYYCILYLLVAWECHVNADGVGAFVARLSSEFPYWLSTNYPNDSYPYPSTGPIKIELREGIVAEDSVAIDVEFYDYQVFNHTRKENWNVYQTLVDLSRNLITVDLNLWRTAFGGTYVANGTYNGSPVNGRGSWSAKGNEFISVAMNYLGAEVTPEDYVDLNAGDVKGGYKYVYGYTSEMEELSAGGNEETVKLLAFNALHNLMTDKLDHPAVAPLNKYLQDAFASTSIPEM